MTAYYGADPHHVLSDMVEMRSHGCTGIVFCITEIDVDLFAGRIEAVIRHAGKEGLDVYINFWGLGGCFATNLMPSKYLCYNPDVCRTGFNPTVNIDTENNTATPRGCINNPKFLEWITAFTSKIISTYPAKGIFWDEPKHGYCRCAHCKERFAEQFGRNMPQKVSGQVKTAFNADITRFLITLFTNAKKTSPEIQNMLCLMPSTQKELGTRNLDRLLRCEALNIYGTDPYWIMMNKNISWMRDEIRKTLALCRKYGKNSHVWIQCHAIPQDREGDVYESVMAAARCGPDIIASWGFKGLNNNNWSYNPEKCWEKMGKAYMKIRNKQKGRS